VNPLPPPLAYIALGANLGYSQLTVLNAMDRLQEHSVEPLLRSSLWQSAPVDCPPNSPPFINAAVGLTPRPDEAPESLMAAVDRLLKELKPVLLLVTLGELGMLLCRTGEKPFHIPTQAQEVFDVSGAGDTVIATFTLAVAGGASPLEAAIISNHAAGIVVGKVGTAVAMTEELLASFQGS